MLHADLVSHPPADGAGVAALLASAVEDVIARGAVPPSRVRVRRAEIATHLAPLLSARAITVETDASLPILEEFASLLRQSMQGLDEPAAAISMPQTWAAWELPDATIAELFAAAADFHAAQPWLVLADEHLLDLSMPAGRSWVASVLGNGGQQYGLVLYESKDDVLCLIGAGSPAEAFLAMRSAMLSLSFDERAGLPTAMQREIARAGWRVNGPHAYPTLLTLNTLGGGLSPAHARDMIDALGVTSRFAAEHAPLLGDPMRAGSVVRWSDAATGVRVSFDDPGAGEAYDWSLWPLPSALTRCRAEGGGADAYARYGGEDDEAAAARDAAIVSRFADAERGAGAADARVTRDVDNVSLFVHAMHDSQGVCVPAVTEFDLRVFLYDWFPRKVRATRSGADTMRGSLRRFFEHLATHEGIVCPWARAILRDRMAFEARWEDFPGGFWWDAGVAEWRGELDADLDDRVMLPSDALAGVGEWGATMGREESRLLGTLQREWLLWRDEVIDAGERLAPAVRAALERRQAEWERQPQDGLGGRSPSEVVRRERAAGAGRDRH